MSYTIYYNALAIKTPDRKYILLLEAGDNNVYDIDYRGREKRSRSWEALTIDNKPAFTREDAGMWLEKRYSNALKWAEGNVENLKSHFGYYASEAIYPKSTRSTTWGTYRNFFLKAFDRAVDYADFVRICGPLKIFYCVRNKDTGLLDWEKTEGIEDYGELMTKFTELESLENFGGHWLSPCNRWKVANLTDAINLTHTPKGRTIEITFEDGEKGFVQKFYPFSLTGTQQAALRISEKKVQELNIFTTVELFTKKVRQIQYGYHDKNY